MSDTPQDEYTPPKVWSHDAENGGKFAGMNLPTAGKRFDRELQVGKHPLQLYSLGTPNGQKITIFLEELLEAGHSGAEYDAWLISFGELDQFGSDFVSINPNSKIPALVDRSDPDKPVNLFESGSILLQLAEKFDNAFLPPSLRAEVLNWLFWQVGSAPYVGGGFGHFYNYAPYKMKYPIDRFTMETKRQLHVLELQLQKTKYIAGDEYTIADMAIFPWYGGLIRGEVYPNADVFLNVKEDYPHVIAWAKAISERPAVVRGRKVNKVWGELSDQLPERHDASDFETKTKDKVESK